MRKGVVEKLMEVLGSEDFEKTHPYMYQDKDLAVTVGIGFKIDSVPEAQQIKFVHVKDKEKRAEKGEIKAEWDRTKAMHKQNQIVPNPTIMMVPDAIVTEFKKRAGEFEAILKKPYCRRHLGDIDPWPADAQLGLLGMVWGPGPGGICEHFPKFCKACRAQPPNFDKAAKESHMLVREQYNEFFATCFHNAAQTLKNGYPLDTLWYPGVL